FFEAEDGIRDGHVTGVQTCALPILDLPADLDRPGRGFQAHSSPTLVDEGPFELVHELELELGHRRGKVALGPSAALRCRIEVGQIGRASCRERGWMGAGARLWKKRE